MLFAQSMSLSVSGVSGSYTACQLRPDAGQPILWQRMPSYAHAVLAASRLSPYCFDCRCICIICRQFLLLISKLFRIINEKLPNNRSLSGRAPFTFYSNHGVTHPKQHEQQRKARHHAAWALGLAQIRAGFQQYYHGFRIHAGGCSARRKDGEDALQQLFKT
jgi:hypothetical protein